MPVVLALLAAVPIELWNIRVAATLFDPGPAIAGWRWKLIARQWVLLHLPGMLALDWLTRVTGSTRLSIAIVFISGYLETAAWLIALALGVQWLRRLAAKVPIIPD